MDWLSPEGLSAIGSAAAVIVALFLFFWDRRSDRARLHIGFRADAPDWSFGALATTGSEDFTTEVFVLRFIADTRGPASAKMVEATIHNVERQQQHAWLPARDFLPSNLRWTHGGERQLPLLIPHAPKHFDFGEVRQNGTGPDCTLLVTITPQPVRAYNVWFPGTYRFSVTLAAENARPITHRFELSFFPEWSSTDDTPIRRGIVLRELSS